MILTTDQINKKENVSWDEVDLSINRLDVIKSAYLILTNSRYNFIVAAPSGKHVFLIEYRDGPNSPIWTTTRKDFSVSEVRDIFQKYYEGDATWKSALKPMVKVLDDAPKWARIVSTFGWVVLSILVILGYNQHNQLFGTMNHSLGKTLYMLLLPYSLTASLIKGKFRKSFFYKVRFFWLALFLAILSSIIALMGLL